MTYSITHLFILGGKKDNLLTSLPRIPCINPPICDQHPRNTCGRQRSNHPTNKRTGRYFGNSSAPAGRQLGKDANLDADRGEIAEAADGVGRDKPGAGRKGSIGGRGCEVEEL